jgi:pimeloyl-ACP methyl ester carboxylesterase
MITRPSRLTVMESGKAPCLWILGRLDKYISCNDIQKKVNLPANCRIEILENSGHLGFVEEEDRSLEIITGFVNNLKNH